MTFGHSVVDEVFADASANTLLPFILSACPSYTFHEHHTNTAERQNGEHMENDTKRTLSLKRFDTTHTMDVTEDFSLPDYIPEVRRIVGVQANANVDGKYRNGDELEADGSVNYTVLYIGSEGGLCAAPLTSSFDGRIPVRSAEDDTFGVDDIALAASAENVICRATAPRRLTVSCKVKLRMFSQRFADCGETVEPPALAPTVRWKKTAVPYAAVKALRTNIECGGEVREREGTKVIAVHGTLGIHDVKTGSDGISVAGEAGVRLLLLTPDGVYTTTKARCAVDTVIPCDTAEVRTAAAYGRCLMCEVEVAEDGLITWTMECDIDCDAVMGGESEISVDGYCAAYADEITYHEAAALSEVKGVNGRLSVSGTKTIRPGMTYAGSWGRASFDRAERNGNKLTLTGSAAVTAILCGEGEAVGEEVVIPVRYECEADARIPTEDVLGKCEFTVTDTAGRCDGETLHVTAELGVNGVFLGEGRVRYVSAIAPDPERPVERKKNVMTVCVPAEGETEWDIMKRYRVAEGAPRRSGKVYIVT